MHGTLDFALISVGFLIDLSVGKGTFDVDICLLCLGTPGAEETAKVRGRVGFTSPVGFSFSDFVGKAFGVLFGGNFLLKTGDSTNCFSVMSRVLEGEK